MEPLLTKQLLVMSKNTLKKGIFQSIEQKLGRLATGCTGIKRTTGQHPGGIIVVPKGREIYEFCPVQHPADDPNSDIITTHFDYHSIDQNLLKLDILGHDDPTMIRMLQDITGKDPTKVPLDDKETMSIFSSTKALGITPEQIHSEVGSFGVPEFGTKFVRGMLVDTRPTTFDELIRISRTIPWNRRMVRKCPKSNRSRNRNLARCHLLSRRHYDLSNQTRITTKPSLQNHGDRSKRKSPKRPKEMGRIRSTYERTQRTRLVYQIL